MGSSPKPHGPLTQKPGVEKSPFQISANRLKVDENVNRAHFRIHWLVVKWCNEQIVQLSPKPQMCERRSSTVCAVVERLDHHCGDDLVLMFFRDVVYRLDARNVENNEVRIISD